MQKTLTIFLSIIFTVSCSVERNLNKNLATLDETYGYCDNPQRQLTDIEYTICKDKERGSGKIFEPKSLSELLSNSKTNTVMTVANVNPDLWQASLSTLQPYSLKIVDSNGGYIETDWIFDGQLESQRCSIKVQVVSSELISTGVNTNFICQKQISDNWINDNKQYVEESKQLTLEILKKARENSELE